MHEYSIVQALVESVAEQARRHGAQEVHRLWVRIGDLSGVEPELLQSAYDTFREHTLCAAADLEIVRVPARWSCPRCDREIERGAPLRCAACGASGRLSSGDEIILDRIEMEVP